MRLYFETWITHRDRDVLVDCVAIERGEDGIEIRSVRHEGVDLDVEPFARRLILEAAQAEVKRQDEIARETANAPGGVV